MELTPRVRQYVETKTSRLDRYMPNLADIMVELDQQNAKNVNERQVAQITIRDTRGTILRAEERTGDMFASIDAVVDKLYRQIKRYRGKRLAKRQSATSLGEVFAELEPLPIEEDLEEATIEDTIVRRKRFPVQPMTPEEAIDQMELLGHDFFVFFNAIEEGVNVVYRRRDGDYGLLQPEID
jgi:putative sigma-54 modulation protein